MQLMHADVAGQRRISCHIGDLGNDEFFTFLALVRLAIFDRAEGSRQFKMSRIIKILTPKQQRGMFIKQGPQFFEPARGHEIGQRKAADFDAEIGGQWCGFQFSHGVPFNLRPWLRFLPH